MKTEIIKFNDFIGNSKKKVTVSDIVKQDNRKMDMNKVAKGVIKTMKYVVIGATVAKGVGVLYHLIVPSGVGVKTIAVMATTTSSGVGWEKVLKKAVEIADYLMRGLLVYNGILWMFGHRSNAISGIIGACVGYLVVRHHEAIRLFIQSL